MTASYLKQNFAYAGDTVILSLVTTTNNTYLYKVTDTNNDGFANNDEVTLITKLENTNLDTGDIVINSSVINSKNITITSTGSGEDGAYVAGDTVILEWNNTADGNSDLYLVKAQFPYLAQIYGGHYDLIWKDVVMTSEDGGNTYTGSYIIEDVAVNTINGLPVKISVQDVDGNITINQSDSLLVLNDTTLPTITSFEITDDQGAITGQLSSGDTTDDTSITLNFTLSENLVKYYYSDEYSKYDIEHLAIYRDDVLIGNADINYNGTKYTFTDDDLIDGSTPIYIARIETDYGYTSEFTEAISLVIDTQGPNVTDKNITLTDTGLEENVYLGKNVVTVTWDNFAENNDDVTSVFADFSKFDGPSSFCLRSEILGLLCGYRKC